MAARRTNWWMVCFITFIALSVIWRLNFYEAPVFKVKIEDKQEEVAAIVPMAEAETTAASETTKTTEAETMATVAETVEDETTTTTTTTTTLINDATAEREVINKIYAIREICGDVCDTKMIGPFDDETGIFVIKKDFNCENIFKHANIHDSPDNADLKHPFYEIPQELMADFTYDGRIQIQKWYTYYDFRNPSKVLTWELDLIEKLVQQVHAGDLNLGGSYGTYENENIMNGLKKMNLQGKRVLGSLNPWLEAMVLAHNVSHIVTLEYATIECSHSQLSSMTPPQFISSYLEGKLEPFDAMVSFSSIEHSGLMRYGDGFHPWGDLVIMSRTWCVLKPDGMILNGVPTDLEDQIVYNVHKCYGSVMTSHLLANFKYIWTSHPKRLETSCGGHVQAVVVAQKIS